MANLTSTLTMRLIDGVSGPAGKVKKSLAGVHGQARGASNAMSGMMLLGRVGGPLAVGAAAAVGAGAAFKSFAETQRRMTRIAITADASVTQQAEALAKARDIAKEAALPFDQVVTGMDALVTQGRSMEDALAFLPSVVRTAQASGAEVADIANTAGAVGTSFGITADQMQSAFDILVAGGKAGKFELKDMARYLPSLAPAAAAVGLKGEEGLRKMVTMLQVVRNQTGTAEEAASSMQNIFTKMESEETAKKFKKFGVDLRKEMAKARESGADLLEVFVGLTAKATKGDLSKIPQLFTDMQFARGMRALLSQPELAKKVWGELGNVSGATMRDFNRVLQDGQAEIDNLGNAWGRFVDSVGRGLNGAGLGRMLNGIAESIDRLIDWNEGKGKRRSLKATNAEIEAFRKGERASWEDSARGRSAAAVALDQRRLGMAKLEGDLVDRIEANAKELRELSSLTLGPSQPGLEHKKLRRMSELRAGTETAIDRLAELRAKRARSQQAQMQEAERRLLTMESPPVLPKRPRMSRRARADMARWQASRMARISASPNRYAGGAEFAGEFRRQKGTSFIPKVDLPSLAPKIDTTAFKGSLLEMSTEASKAMREVWGILSSLDTFSAGAQAGQRYAAGLRSQVGAVKAAAAELGAAATITTGGQVARALDRSRQASMTDRPVYG